MDKKLKAYLQKIGRKGGKAKSEAKAKAARENGKKGGLMKKALLVVVGLFLSTQVRADVKSYAPGSPEYQKDGAIVLEIFRGQYDKAKALKNRREIAKRLFPKGFSKKDVGTLDRDAGGDGYVRFTDGRRFDRASVHEDIAKVVTKMTDLEAMKLRENLKK